MIQDPLLGPTAPLRGMCPMTPARARRGYHITTFLTSMRQPAQRAAFVTDPERCMADYGLSELERALIRARDYTAMLDYGASNVAIGKASGALNVTLLERGAQNRGQSVEALLTERKASNKGQPWAF